MEREDFYDFKVLEKEITKRSAGFAKATQLVVDARYNDSYIIKRDYSFHDDPSKMTIVGLLKARKDYTQEKFDLSQVLLKPKYKTERLLTQLKCKDLKSLIPFLDSEAQNWLKSLLERQEEVRQLPLQDQIESHDDISEEENGLQDYVDF